MAQNSEQQSQSRQPLLDVSHLVVEYRSDTRAVLGANDVSFSIAKGESFGLAGESGCGKSTVANSIMRLLQSPAKITGGGVNFRGENVLTFSDEKLRQFRWSEVAMVFQSAMNSLNPVLTLGEQIEDVFWAHGQTDKRKTRERAAELLELVNITPDRLKSYPHQLSGGMRQRVVIAIALALDPSLLILDEPTTALDVVVQQEIMQQIQALQEEFGFSVLFITHDISLMIEMCDRMAVMNNGRIVEMGSAQDIFARQLHPYTKALMNSFPPLTGERHRLTGLTDHSVEGMGFDPKRIPDLVEVAPGRFVAPTGSTPVPSFAATATGTATATATGTAPTSEGSNA